MPLPQPEPVSDAAMCKARPKIDEHAFKQFHAEILRHADQPGPLWQGHRVFAVDGSKLTLPRPLAAAGYDPPGPHAHYPQGLLSCLFRLARNICPDIDRFIAGTSTDTLVQILPGPATLRALSRKYPGTRWQPVPLRLVKYTHATTAYVLGTTLLDRQRYRVAELADLYHARWGVEEMYKVSKQFLEVDQFHGQSERLVKQELYAHFNLIAMTRLFTNRDAQLCPAGRPPPGKPVPQANFKHSLAALAQHLEGLLLRHSAYVSETLEQICAWVGTGRRKPRPNRSYPRRSLRPAPKWSRRKSATA